jgi:hypothetical protein
MSERSYAVVVLPDDWDGSLEELADQMMPVIRRGPSQVLPLLERGPMTLEADLSVEEAGLLQARLNKIGVPAHVIDGDGQVVAESVHGGSGPEAEPKAEPASGGRIRLPKPKKQSEPEPEPEPEPAAEWANVFADMKDGEKEPKKLKSLDELAGDDLAGDSSDTFGAEPAPKAPPEPKTDSLSPKPPSPQPPKQPPSPGPKTNSKPTPAPKQPASKNPASKRPASFDAGKMSDALSSARGEKPPYAPNGFDDSMSHIPAVAAVLSAVAPGAGQIYNGQGERAREYGVRFALVTPWIDSVRQAHSYAEKIRTYWEPLPEAGSLAAAFKYMGIWWIIVGTVVAGLGWSGSKLYDVVKTPEAPKITKADVGLAVAEASSQVQMARIGGLDGVTEFLDERSRNHKRFTMSKAERAERLFRRGIVYCEKGNYSTCESAMKRVTALSPKLRRDAYRLQAWASVQGQGDGKGEPMPEVTTTGSLEEFEQAQSAEEAADAGGSPSGDPSGDQSGDATNSTDSKSVDARKAPPENKP